MKLQTEALLTFFFKAEVPKVGSGAPPGDTQLLLGGKLTFLAILLAI